MLIQVIFFIVIIALVWVIDVNIIRSEIDKFELDPNLYVHNTEIILKKYEKHRTKNVIIGVTPWGDLCSINDPDKLFENLVMKYMDKTVKVYYKTIHVGIFLFWETNQITRIEPICREKDIRKN